MSSDRGAIDGSIDRLRAYAIVAVVSGHWLVTVLRFNDGSLVADSALRYLPGLTPMTWVLQALAPFFCAAGFVAARGAGRATGAAWWTTRVAGLLRAVASLVAFWVAVMAVLLLAGASLVTLGTLARLVLHPLWFLGVLLLLWLLTPLLVRLDRWCGWWAVAPMVVLVGIDDVTDGPGVLAVVGAWAAAYLVGIRLAHGGRTSWRWLGAVAVVAVLGAAGLVLLGGYPASAVGVTGAGRSNLGPPSLFVVGVGAAQLVAFLVVRRLFGTAPAGRWTTALSRRALPIFLWHQSALLLLVLAASVWAPWPGLVGRPESGLWVAERLACLPLLILLTVGFVALSHRPAGAEKRWVRRPVVGEDADHGYVPGASCPRATDGPRRDAGGGITSSPLTRPSASSAPPTSGPVNSSSTSGQVPEP